MCSENMAKNCPKCCQIAKSFVAITSGKYNYGPGKLMEFFSLTLWPPCYPTLVLFQEKMKEKRPREQNAMAHLANVC